MQAPTLLPVPSAVCTRGAAILPGAAACLLGTSFLFSATTPGRAQTPPQPVLRIAASSELTPVMPVIAQIYQRATGVKLDVTLGPSSSQVARIEAGEPADVFLGADFTYPEKLVADGLTDAKAPVAYADGTLVLFARKDSALQPLSLDSLEDPKLRSLAIADQLHSPLGRAAAAALNQMKLTEKLQAKLVVREDAVEAAAEVASGRAQMALISLAIAKSQRFRQMGSYVLIPASQYPPMKQYAVILRAGNLSESHRFLEWITSSNIQSKLPNVGLDAVR